jgi:hypothetical protein
MAQSPSKTSGTKALNIMKMSRGLFDFRKSDSTDTPVTRSFGTAELIPNDTRAKLLRTALRPETKTATGRPSPIGSVMGLMSTAYQRVGQDRMENRRILELMPDVRKAARLMVASIFSPSDLSRKEIGIQFDIEGVDESIETKLGVMATKFFQKKLNLKTAAPQWVYQFGYETGASVFATVPLSSFEKIHDDSYLATEAFVKDVVEPLCQESLFGFGDSNTARPDKDERIGLETLGYDALDLMSDSDRQIPKGALTAAAHQAVERFLATESLNLTDNPSVLRVNAAGDEKRKRATHKKIKERFKLATHQPLLEIDVDPEDSSAPDGNPLLMRLPPESVTVIHTPGEPGDHQGYLILLDVTGNPVSVVTQDADEQEADARYSKRGNDIFSQINQAYGMGTTGRSAMDRQTMQHLYSKVIGGHIQKRLGKAGYGRVEIPNMDATLRCLFTRMLREKRTRILFLPKELVTYMTFETDQYGYGVSKLNGIKFALGMKMAVQVSRVLASIKSAMDKRLLTLKFDENNMEQPEMMFQTLIDQYIQKTSMTFSTDPGHIQSQIQQKAFTVKAEGIPGMENFSVDNVAADKGSATDFDSSMMEYLDKSIINGMDVPASTMNSLNEDEYARSVTTTNLFFAMEVQIYQDAVIKHISDVIRKYARFSAEFQKELLEIVPELGKKRSKGKDKGNSSTDESALQPANGKEAETKLPADCTLETLLEGMSITLPKPNIAPSKAQFESMDGMISAITNLVTSLFPDELAGSNDKLRATIGLLRSRIVGSNIRDYLESVGMSGVQIPEGNNFSDHLSAISELHNGLENLTEMVESKIQIREAAKAKEAAAAAPMDPMSDPNNQVPPAGY